MSLIPERPSGFYVLDKPAGASSARALNAVKRCLPRGTKIGHAGTLDPFATGVLVVLVGRTTKLCERVMGLPKGYVATIRLGATTATFDPETTPIPTPAATPPTVERIAEVLAGLIGEIEQVPPAYSAIKVGGRRAYELARGGTEVRLAARRVRVDRIELLRYAWPDLDVSIVCGRGFYVRSLARDVGAALGVGGYLTALRRTFVGQFRAELARGPNDGPLTLLPSDFLDAPA